MSNCPYFDDDDDEYPPLSLSKLSITAGGFPRSDSKKSISSHFQIDTFEVSEAEFESRFFLSPEEIELVMSAEELGLAAIGKLESDNAA